MKRILITGGSSYLGQHLVPIARRQFDVCYTYYQNDPLNLTVGKRLELRHAADVLRLVSDFCPYAIVHAAGSNRSPDMESVICEGATNIVEAAKKYGARIVHLSTDVVFDGKNAPYKESDCPNPTHAYGQAKAKAEEIVHGYADHVIIRTSLIYGLSIMDRSTEWIAAALAMGQPVMLFNNQFRQPVWAETLSLACLELALSNYCGFLNVAGGQVMSRAEFGLKMLDWWGVRERDGLSIGPSDETWPLDTRLDLSLAKATLETPLLGLEEVLAAHLRRPG